ncbi:DnaJ domain-containing protein [Kordiimonas laminariae]|uniref:DnaJ domain-containing protein n=1 Tax=Kordiimonas laminariae TaxID=2917717 RepID=UPI001FF42D5B|nr:DnaJ domain-containing protein [Kordiimonas laminariae]MCK0069266.1 DnaJ domain-containing protein [Kordiimonas laminariae]
MASDYIKSFGFPRWGEYGLNKETEALQMCDYVGCSEVGPHPAPKSPGSNERWYFCKKHAAEYNRNWDFFQGMSDEEAQRHMHDSSESSDAFASAKTFEWGGAMDEDGFTSTEQSAFDTLEVDSTATQEEIKRQYRKLAKLYHPDTNPGDSVAAEKFHQVQQAYDLLREKNFPG